MSLPERLRRKVAEVAAGDLEAYIAELRGRMDELLAEIRELNKTAKEVRDLLRELASRR